MGSNKDNTFTIGADTYKIVLKDIGIAKTNDAVLESKSKIRSEFEAELAKETTTTLKTQYQKLKDTIKKEGQTIDDLHLVGTGERGTNSLNVSFQISKVSGNTVSSNTSTPSVIKGKLDSTGTGSWTNESALNQGVTVDKDLNVKKGDDTIGKFVGQTDGSYTFTYDKEGFNAISKDEVLKVGFKQGDSKIQIELNGIYTTDAKQDLDSVYTTTAKDVDFTHLAKLVAKSGSDIIDLTNSTANTLQNVTKANFDTYSDKNTLYIRGDIGDQVTLGSLLETGDVQIDNGKSWVKTTNAEVGHKGDGQIYDLWTYDNGATKIYIDHDITVL